MEMVINKIMTLTTPPSNQLFYIIFYSFIDVLNHINEMKLENIFKDHPGIRGLTFLTNVYFIDEDVLGNIMVVRIYFFNISNSTIIS